MGADETQIEASFCEAIRVAKERKSVSLELEKRAEETYADYLVAADSAPGFSRSPIDAAPVKSRADRTAHERGTVPCRGFKNAKSGCSGALRF
jgi:hypothetical protein